MSVFKLMLSQVLLFVHQYFGLFLALISVENDTEGHHLYNFKYHLLTKTLINYFQNKH